MQNVRSKEGIFKCQNAKTQSPCDTLMMDQGLCVFDRIEECIIKEPVILSGSLTYILC